MKEPIDTTKLLTVKEAAARLRCSSDFVRNLALRREIEALKVSGKRGRQGGRYL